MLLFLVQFSIDGRLSLLYRYLKHSFCDLALLNPDQELRRLTTVISFYAAKSHDLTKKSLMSL
jgi:hypothetical protein